MLAAYGAGGPTKTKSVTWADPVDDCGGLGGVRQQRAAAAAAEAREEGRFWGAGSTAGKADDDEDNVARQGFEIGAVHLLKKQVCARAASAS